jgi:hypothetical protein
MKAVCLVVVSGGVAECYEPEHVDCRIVDLDDLRAGGKPVGLPAGMGFEELAARAGLENGRDCIIAKARG